MSAAEKTFVDTNVFVYSIDKDAGPKHVRAKAVLSELWQNGNGILSSQVLSEWSVNAKRLGNLPWHSVAELIEPYLAWEVVSLEKDDPVAALQLAETHRISYWDALVVRAAIKGGATVLLSEDLNDGQEIEGVTVRNPFR